MSRRLTAGLLAAGLLAASRLAAGPAGPPDTVRAARWRSLSSDAFLVLYPAEREGEAMEALAVLERERAYVQSIVGGPTRRVAVSIQDLGIESNGLTDPAYRRVVLFPTAPGAGDLSFHESWWRLVGVHEYTHWQHLSAGTGLPGLLVALAGTWAAPGNSTPSWLKEGICVYAESGLSPYEGRLNEGTYEATLAAMVREGRLPSLVEATFQPVGFPGAAVSVRLLGGSFFAYLARTYGPDSLSRFFEHFASSGWSYLSPLLPWAGLDRSARKAFGKGMRGLWLDWQLDLIDRYAPLPASTSAADPAAQPGWRAGATAAWQGMLYYQRQRLLKAAAFQTRWVYELVRYDPATERTEVLHTSTAPFHGPLRVRYDTLYFAMQELHSGYANREYGSYGFEAVLYGLDLRQPRRPPRAVLRGTWRAFEVLPGGAVLLSRDRIGAFGSEIRVVEGDRSRRLLDSEWRVEELLHDGQEWLYLSARLPGENPGMYRLVLSASQVASLAAEGAPELGQPERILDTAYAEREVALSGEFLLFSANWGGRHAIYAWHTGDGSLARLDTGGDYSVAPASAGDRLYFVGLGAAGYDLRSVPSAPEALPPAATLEPSPNARPQAGAPPPLPQTEPRLGRAGYLHNLGSLLPRALLPLLAYDAAAGSLQAGAVLSGRSVLGDVFYAAGAYYDSAGRGPELTMYVEALLLPPVELAVSYATAGADRLSAALELPLYRSLRPGLSRISVQLAGSIFEDDYSRRALEPWLRVGLQAPRGALELAAGFSVESQVLGSALEGRALLAAVGWRQLLFGAQLDVFGSGVHELADVLWSLPPPRGYAEGPETGTGAVLSAELSLPLLRLRRGLWNPAVFFEDLFLVPFFDLAAGQSAELQWSAGGSLHIEVKGLAEDQGVPLDLSLGFVVTREGLPGLLLGLELPLLAESYAGAGVGLPLPGHSTARPGQ